MLIFFNVINSTNLTDLTDVTSDFRENSIRMRIFVFLY